MHTPAHPRKPIKPTLHLRYNVQSQTLRRSHYLLRDHLLPDRLDVLIHTLYLCDLVDVFERDGAFARLVAYFSTTFIYPRGFLEEICGGRRTGGESECAVGLDSD